MTLSVSVALALAARCAPGVAPETLLSIAHTESRFDPLAIGVNGAANPPPAHTPTEAAAVARRYIAAGYSVDLGIAQINSRNLAWLALSIEDAFDPCRNLAAAAQILTDNFTAVSQGHAAPTALGIALSLYNTGDRERGFRNGYVLRVYRSAAVVVPAIARATVVQPTASDPTIPNGSPLDPAPGRAAASHAVARRSSSEVVPADAQAPVMLRVQSASSPPVWDVFGPKQQSSVIIFKGVAQ